MTSLFKLNSLARALICFPLLIVAMSGTLKAQDLQTQMAKSNEAYKAQQYNECQDILQRIVNNFGRRAPMLYGPKFGGVYYRKGLVELKLANDAKRANNLADTTKWFKEASKSFQTCYEKFPNGAEGMAKTTNTVHKSALQRWAESQMGMKAYEDAIKLYKKFLAERDKTRDKLLPTPGGFYINLAICNFLMEKPNIVDGIRYFETALKNKKQMKTKDASVVFAFLALSQAVIKDKDEKAMVDFLNKNRADISLEPYQMYEFTPLFMKLASNSLEVGMHEAAINLYSLIPSTEDVIQDIQVRLDLLPGRRGIMDGTKIIEVSRLKQGLEKMKEKLRSGDPDDVGVLTAMCYLHDKAGNQRGVYGGLELLERYYNKSKKRESNLYNLVRVSSIIDQLMDTEKYGKLFLTDFPESDKAEAVRRLMLTSLYFAGEYEKSLQVAQGAIDVVPKPSEQHDICLFVLGGSHFYLGSFEEAQPYIDQHILEYPDSKLIMHSEYYQASNMIRLQYWDKAAELLDKFLGKYPEPDKNIYLPIALYDRANCHFSESEYEPALKLLERLENEFPKSGPIAMAYNMKGNILESTAEFEEAEKYYKLALDAAEKAENKSVAGEAISYLVGMLATVKGPDKDNPTPRLKDAVPYYDKFMKEYASSPFKPQVVVHGMASMKAVGRERAVAML